jgi:type I restriction enzyme S subunit
LVAQDLGDEPASVLLERIAAERSRLIQKKQIKPSKPLRDINLTIPPLAEQKRIVATVDRLMAHCDRLQTQLQTRSDRARALLHSAIHPLSPTA